MDDANVEPNEWWPMGDGRSSIPKKDVEILATHKRDEATYIIHLFAFKKAFLDFISCNPNNIKPSSPIQEVKEANYNGIDNDTHQEKPQKLK